jgi:hypothetical protein
MKRLLFILMAVFSITGAQAQVTYPSNFTKLTAGTFRTQLLNTSSTIPNAVLDTQTNSTALYLTVAKRTSTNLATAYPIFADATMSFIVSGIKISGTLAGTLSLEESFDGTIYGPVRNATQVPVSTLTGTTTTTYSNSDAYTVVDGAAVISYSWDLPYRYAPYYRVKIVAGGTQTSSWRAWLCFSGK